MPLLALLLQRAAPGVWRLNRFDTSDQRLAEGLGFVTVETDLTNATTKEQLLSTVAGDLDLPNWFGHNWDALADALGDWALNRRSLWILRNSDNLAENAADDFQTFADIASDAFDGATGSASCLLIDLEQDVAPDLENVV